MENTTKANNAAVISGVVNELPIFSHTMYDEDFYTFPIQVMRTSGTVDVIRVVLPEKVYASKNISLQDVLRIQGQYRSRNVAEHGKNHLALTLFATHVELLIGREPEFQNDISLCGFICKPVLYRQTPLGREISDILIAVNRKFGKSDYIPCVAWGRNAVFASQLKVGTQIQIKGRIQSRTYTKKTDEGERNFTANEVSIVNLMLAD